MDPILAAIDEGLKNKGLSDAAASRLAVGHPSLIKNFRAARSGEKRYNVSALQKLADVLDLEFYFGPPREVTPRGFAEEAALAFERQGAPKHVSEVFEKGYLPFPWHNLTPQPTPPPFAISLAWLEQNGVRPDRLRFVEVAEHSNGPTIALVDAQSAHSVGVATWCWLDKDVPRLEWAMRDEDGPLIIFPDADVSRAIRVDPKEVAKFRFLGRAVWTTRLEPADIA